MLQKHIDPNCILINLSFHNFKNVFCQIKSNLNLKSSFLTQKFLQGFGKSKKLGHFTSGSGGKKTFKQSEQMKKSVKNFFLTPRGTPFMSKSFQI